MGKGDRPLRDPGLVARRRRRTRIAALAAAGGLALLAFAALLSWHYSSGVLVPDHSSWSEKVTVEAVGARSVTLERSEAALRPGFYGLVWEGGHAVVGPIAARGETTVTRRLIDRRGYLVPDTEVGFETSVYTGGPLEARGLPYRDVSVRGDLGPMPAWLVPARGHTWAIVVHGINDDPEIGLRIAPALHRLGLSSLLITYRDDRGAPASPDGLHHMGLTEWRDLEAAARYALSRGACHLVLVGYSMGGAIVAQFMEKSALAGRAAALVLDSPALNWKDILEFNAERLGFPPFLALPVEWAIDVRIDPDWASLDALSHPGSFQLPVLLFHGRDDEVVPIATSDEFAERLPEWVTYYRVPRAGHTQSWNVDPPLYTRHLRAFLAEALNMRVKQDEPDRNGRAR